jgi:hypothetical protein
MAKSGSYNWEGKMRKQDAQDKAHAAEMDEILDAGWAERIAADDFGPEPKNV